MTVHDQDPYSKGPHDSDPEETGEWQQALDELVDAIGLLAEDGSVWVLTPKTGRDGYVEPSEISEAAPTAGLNQTSVASLGEWAGSRLVQRR